MIQQWQEENRETEGERLIDTKGAELRLKSYYNPRGKG